MGAASREKLPPLAAHRATRAGTKTRRRLNFAKPRPASKDGAAEDERVLKPVLGALLQPLLAIPHPDETLIRDLMAMAIEPDVVQAGDIAHRLDIAAPAPRGHVVS